MQLVVLRRGFSGFRALFVCLFLLVLSVPAFAQSGGTPVQIGQNVSGTLTIEAPTVQFSFTAAGGESAAIQLLGLTPGFALRLQVLNPAGVEMLALPNPTGQTILAGNVNFSDVGVYTLVVSGEGGSVGQFVLSLQPGTPLPAPTPLTLDQPVTGTVGSANPVLIYSFTTSASIPALLSVASQTPNAGALVMLYDETLHKTIATSDASIVGVVYQLPAAQGAYRVEIHASGAGDTSFTICAGNCAGFPGGAAANLPTPDFAAPTQQVAAACTASSSAGGSVNLRTGPGTNYAALAMLPLGQTVQVVGQWTNGGWYAVNAGSQTLWVGASVVTLSGDCSALPPLNAPANVQLAPTQVPTQPAPAPTVPPPNEAPEVEPTTENTPLPNLTIINVRLTVTGADLNAGITIMNSGTAPLTPDQTFSILTCIDGFDNCNEDRAGVMLQPGETVIVSTIVPAFTGAGSHSVNITLDERSEIAELNESDNSAFSSFNS